MKAFKSYLFLVLIFFVIIIFLSTNVFSQAVQQWASRYNGPGNGEDEPYAMAIDNSGNVYVTGYSTGSGTYWDVATIKYNNDGVQQWIVRYNGPGNYYDLGRDIAVDSSGNVYVTGISAGSGTGDDYVTIKYNSAGVQQWEAIYDGPGNAFDSSAAIAIDNSGNVYVTGVSDSTGSNAFDWATVKYNSAGVQQWASRYNGTANLNDYGYDITVDSSGNVYVAGSSRNASNNADYLTLKYNSSGVKQWEARYDGPGNDSDIPRKIAIDTLSNVYVTGASTGASSYNDYATIKYNNSGVQQWLSRYNGPLNGTDIVTDLALDNSGNVYVTGTSYGTYTDILTLKYNSSGAQQWEKRFDGCGGDDDGNAMAVDSLGNVYVAGSTYFYSTSSWDFLIIKYDNDGNEEWTTSYDGLGSSSMYVEDSALDIVVDNDSNVYVTGYSFGTGTDFDYATVKYSPYVASVNSDVWMNY